MRDIADKFVTKVYKLGQIIYVPHYQDATAFVRPGFGHFHRDVYAEKELIDAGATPSTLLLWPRSRFGSMSKGA
jgi:hypothetical protein